MSPTPRATRDVPAEDPVRIPEFIENIAALYRKGVECMAKLQNQTIDCAVQHNKETLELWKQTMEKMPWAPRVNMFDGFAGTLDRFAEAQKATVNLAVDQTRAFVEMVKERTASAGKTADSISKFAQQSFDRSIAAQKEVAEATVAETKSAFDNARERFVVPGGEAVAESIWRGVDTVINVQKELIETASSRWTPAPEAVTAP